MFRLANKLHMRTKPSTIADQLLFTRARSTTDACWRNSERILRGTRYLQDADIVPVAYHDGVVDVEVASYDVWTLNPGISFGRKGGTNSTGFKLEELNLLGYGSQVSIGRKSDVDRTSTTLLYRDPQLFGTWWRGYADYYSDNSDGRTKELNLEHPFLCARYPMGHRCNGGERRSSGFDIRPRRDSATSSACTRARRRCMADGRAGS
ncbi:MAG: hypothetical protein WDO56_37470 [Gammaproteobacteria bacterium]